MRDMRRPFARFALLLGMASIAAVAAAQPTICPNAPHLVAPAFGQPPAIGLYTGPSDARVWIADTVAHRCLGFVAPKDTTPLRWLGYVPIMGYAEVTFPSTADGGRGSPTDAVRALLVLLGVAAPPVPVLPPVQTPNAPPTTSTGTSTALSRFFADFVTYSDKLWASEGAAWAGDYYDRCAGYYLAAARAEFAARATEYRRRAHAICVDYRTKYLEPNAYGSSPHWAQLEGLAIDAAADTASRAADERALLGTADKFWLAFPPTSAYLKPVNGESRIAARVTLAQLLSYEHASPTQQPQYAHRLDAYVDAIAAWQAADGSYPAIGQVCGGQLNYMVGLLNTVLIHVYTRYRADARIPGMVQRAADYLWSTQWVPAKRAFQYASVDCASKGVGGPTPAPDLNQLIAPSFAWLGRLTGDTTYTAHADAIFAGGVTQAYLAGTKQFNENYTPGFQFLAWRGW